MTRLLCGPLAAWANAWLGGGAAFDDVLTAASIDARGPALALARSQPGRSGEVWPAGATTGGDRSSLGEVLIAWRQAGARARLVLPVAGDTRGMSGPDSFRLSALDAGQAVIGCGPAAAVAVVPIVTDHRPSSAPPTLTWWRYDVVHPSEDFTSIADAQYQLTEAIRECATVLAREHLPSAGDTYLGDDLNAARRAGERINLPPGFPAKAVALVAQAERMSAIVSLTGSPDSATSAAELARTSALEPLVIAVRRARLAGYNAID